LSLPWHERSRPGRTVGPRKALVKAAIDSERRVHSELFTNLTDTHFLRLLLLPLPVPFNNAPPAFTVILLAAGMLKKDAISSSRAS
jgi:hypothetical protein